MPHNTQLNICYHSVSWSSC